MSAPVDPFAFPIPEDAFRELERIYADADLTVLRAGLRCKGDGACCRFERSGLRLFTTLLEAAYLVRRAGPPAGPARSGVCPYLAQDRCGAREGRLLGCRLYFCDPRVETLDAESFHQMIKALHGKYGILYRYAELHQALSDAFCKAYEAP